MCWFEKNKQLLARERRLVKEHFPELKFYTAKEKTLILAGEIKLKQEDEILDVYEAEIIFPNNYPHGVPLLREVGGRIPRVLDRHTTKNGFCCLCVRGEYRKFWKQGDSIVDFINKLVIPYLANQSYYERMGEWSGEEYSHGVKGTIEFYKDALDVEDEKIIILFLEKIINGEKIGRNEKCFCGSNKKIKKCHLQSYSELKNSIYKEGAIKDLEEIGKYVNKQIEEVSKELK